MDKVFLPEDLKPLSADEVERAGKFRTKKLQHRFAAGRALLRRLLARFLEIEPESVRFRYGAFGKPTLDQRMLSDSAPIYFNVSHCRETAVFAFSLDPEIGIDVEKFRSLPDEAEIAKRFFQRDEWAEYRNLPPQLRTQGFLNAWTRKEAILKARGEGLNTPLDSFQVSLDPQAPCCIRNFFDIEESVAEWSLHAFQSTHSTIASVAARPPAMTLKFFDCPPDLLGADQRKLLTNNPTASCPSLPY